MKEVIISKTILIAILLILPSWKDHLRAQEEWTLRKQEDGIRIYTRTRADSPLKEYRFSAGISAPLDVVFEFLSNVSLHTEWVYNCVGVFILEQIPGEKIIYHTSYDLPWPVSDRDLVAEARTTWEEDSTSVRILTEESAYTFKLKKDVIRMPDYREDVILERKDGEHTLFRTEGYADPGGSVPAWLTNLFLVDGIFDSVVRIKELTEY